MMEKAISAKGIEVCYDGRAIFEDISFDLMKGEVVGIIGRSGGGKTTLLNAVAGLVPYVGEISRHGRMSYVFQSNALFPWMTIGKNVLFGISNQPRAAQKETLNKLVHLLGIQGLEKRYPYQVSGGQAQRAAVGRALAVAPEIILMDEPFASLDFYTRKEMEEWLAKICEEQGPSVLLVSHNIEEALYLADRVLLLKAGKFQEFKVPFSKPRLPELRYSPEFVGLTRELVLALSDG